MTERTLGAEVNRRKIWLLRTMFIWVPNTCTVSANAAVVLFDNCTFLTHLVRKVTVRYGEVHYGTLCSFYNHFHSSYALVLEPRWGMSLYEPAVRWRMLPIALPHIKWRSACLVLRRHCSHQCHLPFSTRGVCSLSLLVKFFYSCFEAHFTISYVCTVRSCSMRRP